MLVMPSDSGYNSPCDGIGPSSLYSPLEELIKPDIKSVARRKLRFESHTYWSSESYITPVKSRNSSREIARRLVQMCDLFEKEFAGTSEIAEEFTWTAFDIFRLFGF